MCLLMLLQLFPAIAQLEERGTVVETQKSLGRWFDSGSRENFLFLFFKHLKATSAPAPPRRSMITRAF